ncbi:MAG: efflux RND transporter periplasmic adaptor subunit [Lachnospiraceae bacterium]|nr:efflux RND transporter periplasmic adaptor subunit [Lachnospiraceae bacterium]
MILKALKNRYVFCAFLFAFIVSVSFAGCASKEEKDIPVLLDSVMTETKETQIIRADLFDIEIFDGEVVPLIKEFGFETSGIVSMFELKVGDEVEEGELIGLLDESSILSERTSILDEINGIKSDYNALIQKLLDENNLPETTWQQKEMNELYIKRYEELCENKLIAYYEKLALQEEKLGHNQIVSDISGAVIAVGTAYGKSVRADEPVIAIADYNDLHIITDFIQESKISKYDDIYAIVEGKKEKLVYVPYDALVYQEMITSGTALYSYFTFENEKLSEAVFAGDYFPIIFVSNLHKNVICVSNNCIMTDENGDYVYILTDNLREKRYVTLGFRGINETEILEGAKEGERVYVR